MYLSGAVGLYASSMTDPSHIAIIGGGPAGLMAAEALTARGFRVDLYDAMPSLGRKFLMAGKSGLNLTHAEPFDTFMTRFGAAAACLRPILGTFGPDAARTWAENLGIQTFVGTSGRVFPTEMKAAPLLRAWLRRLRANGMTVHARHKWMGWSDDGALLFATPDEDVTVRAAATVLALGGASWPRLGSDAAWAPWLIDRGVRVTPFAPSNCGFNMDFSPYLFEHFEGHPLKGIALTVDGEHASGDCVLTRTGLEGGPVYTLSAAIRRAIRQGGRATVSMDLIPDLDAATLTERLGRPRGKKSMATHLKRTVGLSGVKAAMLREGENASAAFDDPALLAVRIKTLPLTALSARPIAEAISSAGGVAWDQVTDGLELKALPGVYIAGEMLDWDAPTGGYLLTACMATGKWAGEAAARSFPPNAYP